MAETKETPVEEEGPRKGATPMYLTLGPIFHAPGNGFGQVIPAGSIIRTNAKPHDQLKPLNGPAEEAMEAWYNEVHTFYETIFNEQGEPEQKVRKVQPHLKYKIAAETNQQPVHEMEVVRGPEPNAPGGLSLAETLAQFKSTDQRPGPAYTMPPGRLTELQKLAEVDEEAVVTRGPDPTQRMRVK